MHPMDWEEKLNMLRLLRQILLAFKDIKDDYQMPAFLPVSLSIGTQRWMQKRFQS